MLHNVLLNGGFNKMENLRNDKNLKLFAVCMSVGVHVTGNVSLSRDGIYLIKCNRINGRM